jgi:hypothetical protein
MVPYRAQDPGPGTPDGTERTPARTSVSIAVTPFSAELSARRPRE